MKDKRFEDEFFWPCNPRLTDEAETWRSYGARALDKVSADERYLVENRAECEVLAMISDDTLSYEYDEMAVVRCGGELFLLHTSGCSCPSPSETWSVTLARTTPEAINEAIDKGRYPGCTYPVDAVAAFKAEFAKSLAVHS